MHFNLMQYWRNGNGKDFCYLQGIFDVIDKVYFYSAFGQDELFGKRNLNIRVVKYYFRLTS